MVRNATRLAIFDLDGTLVRGDSFLPYLASYARRKGRLLPIVIVPFVVALYGLRVLKDRTAKQLLIRAFLRGELRSDIEAHTAWFLDRWVKSRLKAGVLERLVEHQRSGDQVVLVSASPDVYVRSIGRMLGCHATISTAVRFSGDVCEGSLEGPNCKGVNKVEAMKRHLGGEIPPPGSCAYGDSSSDLPLLRWVEHGYLVKGQKIERLSSPAPASLAGILPRSVREAQR